MHEGGCLCGEIRYEVEEISDSGYCHCALCRKATGGALLTWARVEGTSFKLCSGAPSRYAASENGWRCFCGRCGSTVYFEARETSSVTVYLGTLDHPEDVPPRVHRCIEARLPWLSLEDDLPRYEGCDIPEPAARLEKKSAAASPLDPINIEDYHALARERLTTMAYDYYDSGAHDEITLKQNKSAFDRIELHHRVMADVGARDLSIQLLGHHLKAPFMIAPTAFHKMAHREGELATVRAADSAGSIMILSTLSNTTIEKVTTTAKGPVWFQLYIYQDRVATQALIQRAEAAGCKAIVLTVDAPLLGVRERDVRNGFHLPPNLHIENVHALGMGQAPQNQLASGLASYFRSLIEPRLSWRTLDWLASVSRLPILVKGVVRPEDAVRALDHGASGVIVSNHGGRQLDTSPSTISVLPAIAEATQDLPGVLLLDGGIRRGTDILKAIACGADAVLIGRPVLWGLAVGGESGVRHILEILRSELDLAMALSGCRDISEITPALLQSNYRADLQRSNSR